MSIIIGADIVPVDSNRNLFENGLADQLVGEDLLEIISQADFRIFNLEVPLADTATPIEKHGRNLIASTKSVNGIKEIGANLVTMANNHIMDQGIPGLQSTFHTLNNAGIKFFGAGLNLQEAQKPYYFTSNDIKYGVYACAEHEFSIAREDYPGANPFDPLESLDHIASMKAECDYAIVLYHGGKEQYRYSSPNLQKVCRKIIDKGADLVVCQHSHCIGCKEQYKNGTIVYGQGNFLFSEWDNEYWNTGLLLRLTDDNKIEYIPVERYNHGIHLPSPEKRKIILEEFEKRSEEIQQSGFIEKHYTEYVDSNSDEYMLLLSGTRKSLLFRIANKISRGALQKTIIKRYKRWAKCQLKNYIECETHREIIITELQKKQ